jgi:hypothetical protein
MEHEIVRSGIAVTVDYISMSVLTCPVEIVPVTVLEDHERRLHLDCHDETVPCRCPTVPMLLWMMSRPFEGFWGGGQRTDQ